MSEGMEVKVKFKASGDYLVEVGHVILNYPESVVEGLVKLMDYRLTQLTPEDKAALEKSLASYRTIALKLVKVDNPTVQYMLNDLTPLQKVVLCRIDKTSAVKNKVMSNLPKAKRMQLEEDLERYDRITVKKALNQMDQIIPILKNAILVRKQINAERA